MDFRLLGPIEAERACGGTVPLAGSKVHTVLAALLLAEGRLVSDTRLAALLWGFDPPATADAQIYTYMSRLRKHLGDEVEIVRRRPGYVLRAPDASIDLAEFTRLDRLGRAALAERRFGTAATLLRDALGLWRGTALANATEELAEAELPRLEEARLIALESRIEADLALGRHEETVAELTGLVSEHPVRERLRAQLMTALYRCGRQADALHAYYEGRALLVDRLGVDPGEALGSAFQAVLEGGGGRSASMEPGAPSGPSRPAGRRAGSPTGSPGGSPTAPPVDAPVVASAEALVVASAEAPVVASAEAPVEASAADEGGGPIPVTAAVTRVVGRSVPTNLPASYGELIGRGPELGLLRDRLRDHDGRHPRRLLITGTAGAGKTALAVRAARDSTAWFPDGQLYVELCRPDGAPRDPAEVLVRLLRALGDPAAPAVRGDLEELVRLFRTRTSGARLLLVLDGAVDDRQLAPLLPGAPEAAVLVTGQTRLARVAATDTVALPLLDDTEARELLGSLAGRDRLDAEPDATRELVAYCAGLPLALSVVGARLAARPHWPVARLAARLADPDARLDELAYGDASVRETLLRAVRRLDRTDLSVLTGLADAGAACFDAARPFTARAAARVLGMREVVVEDVLEALVERALLQLSGLDAEGRPLYRCGELVRLLASSPAAGGPAAPAAFAPDAFAPATAPVPSRTR
ncbi:BTAD domain-containing putative transcriptional regulator [Streptomyces sp. NPDC056480]|uniref:AfsR/SARP family transcriptional regulator n=1 Tax=Streptomyces sp. NPDC056480 TaxID=3345833 RepID=UPI0036BD31B8